MNSNNLKCNNCNKQYKKQGWYNKHVEKCGKQALQECFICFEKIEMTKYKCGKHVSCQNCIDKFYESNNNYDCPL